MIKINRISNLTCLLFLVPALGHTQTCNNSIIETTPTAQFMDNTDGTVTDTKTGLIWKRCSEGQQWNGSSCANSPSNYNWKDALLQAEKSRFGDHSDWRLPNIKELHSIVETRCYDPAINLAVFPNTSASSIVWSSSPVAYANSAWMVYFNSGYGDHGWDYEGNSLQVRLVRSGQ